MRNLKVMALAAIALAALGVLAVSGAQAAEFHCSVEPCRYTLKPDGAGKTAHHVFAAKRGAEVIVVTCETSEGEATSSNPTSKELTFTRLGFFPCTLSGVPASIRVNGCEYVYSSAGELTIKCAGGKGIEFSTASCTVRIEPQGPLPGIKYHDAGATKSELTLETSISGLKGEIIGTEAGCAIKPGSFSEGEYRTGNAIITAETDNAEAKMANVWWE
jgi:hypothetical protein